MRKVSNCLNVSLDCFKTSLSRPQTQCKLCLTFSAFFSTFPPCKIHYRIKRMYTGRGNKLQRWGERVIVKRTLPIPALKLTWGLLKLQPDIRLDKDARKGPYVATGDSIPLPYITCPSLVPSFQPWTCQEFSVCGAPWMQVSKRSPRTRPAPCSLGCPSLIPTAAL